MSVIRGLLFIVLGLGMVGMTYQNVASLSFLVPSGKIFVETSVKAVRVSISAKTDLTTAEMSKYFTEINTAITNFKSAHVLTSSPTLNDTYLKAIAPGEKYLAMVYDLCIHMYTFMDTGKDLAPQSSCVFNYTLLEKSSLAEGTRVLQAKLIEIRAIITGSGVSTEEGENKILLDQFSLIFNSITMVWYTHMSTVIANLDTLDGLQFPENLKGHLETLNCIKNEGAEFEQITVISSTPGNKGLTIELDIGVPMSHKEMERLTPITYNGVQLRGEAEYIYFARDIDTTLVKLLNCTNTLKWINQHAPVCHELPFDENCKKGLVAEDTPKVLKNCLFMYSSPPSAIRLIDNGILIQKAGLTVTDGGRTVYQSPPYILYTKKEVKVAMKGEELIFPALTIPTVENIVTSRLTALEILAMMTKCFWDTFWINFDYTEYLDWFAIGVEGIILLPLSIVGICLGCKNRINKRANSRLLAKERRKQNLRETRALLRESRL
jgi:hypothetical protein